MWYYTINGEALGPLDDAALDKLIADGTVNHLTPVWKEGMAQWAPLREARAPAGLGTVAEAPSLSTCSMCGKNVGSENLIDLLGRRVCADCKPMAVQALREGAALEVKDNGPWRDGKKVVTHDKSSFPQRCYKCNQATEEPPKKRKLSWHSPVFFILVLLSPVIYIIVAILVRKRATIDVHLCAQHARRRKVCIILGWSGVILGLLMCFVGLGGDMDWLFWLGALVFVTSIIIGVWGAAGVRAVRIKDGTVWLTGPGREFVAGLPPWPQGGGS
jgi:hypothetical protein